MGMIRNPRRRAAMAIGAVFAAATAQAAAVSPAVAESGGATPAVSTTVPPNAAPRSTSSPAPVSNPAAGDEWFARQRVGNSHASPSLYAHAVSAAQAVASALPQASAASGSPAELRPRATGATWTAVGPQTITDNDPNGTAVWGSPYAGRITSMALGSAVGTIYAGSGGGGLWKTTNDGASWTPLTDSQPSLSVGSVFVDTSTTPETLYVGTGENDSGSDSFYGEGIEVSTDGGSTWTTLAGSSVFDGHHIASVVVTHPAPGTTDVFEAGDTGIYGSTDGGTTFTRLGITKKVSAMVVAPGSTSVLYAAVNGDGIYESSNAGTASPTFSILGGGLSSGADVGRSSLAVAPGNAHDVYASVSCGNRSGCSNGSSFGALLGFYSSTDGGSTWHRSSSAPDYFGGDLFYQSPAEQGWYDSALAVSPTSPTTVVAGGIGIVETTDGGSTWQDVNDAADNTPMHPDTHSLVFDPLGTLYVGNDGGVYRVKSPGNGESVSNLNSNLNVTQFYPGISVVNNGAQILAGAQDNGTPEYAGSLNWTIPSSSACGGDGAGSALNPLDPSQYFCITDQKIAGSNPNVTSPAYAAANWVMPLALVPNASSPDSPTLYLGADHVWRSTDGGISWSQLASYGAPDSPCTQCVSALAASPTNPQVVYAGWGDGTVQYSNDGGTTWNTVSGITADDGGLWVTHIAVSPTDPSQIAVTYSGDYYPQAYPSNPGVAVVTGADTGSPSFANVSGNLPKAPTNAAAFNGTGLVVASDVGVFSAVPAGSSTSWARLGTGLPAVQVVDLTLTTDGTLVAATHGRGAWTIPLGTSSGSGGTSTEQMASTVSSSPASVPADGTSTSTITVKLQAQGSPMAGKTVTLTPLSGSSTVSCSARPCQTDTSGSVIFTVTDARAESVTYAAEDTSSSVALNESATVTFTAVSTGSTGQTSPSESYTYADVYDVTPDGSSTATITVVLLDASDNPEVGHAVTLNADGGSSVIHGAPATTDSTGTATFTVTDATDESVDYTAVDSTDSVTVKWDTTIYFDLLASGGGTFGPTIDSIAPVSGPVTGGTTVTINGSGLTGATAVDFGSVAATSFTARSDQKITAVSPAEPFGTVNVTVKTSQGVSVTWSGDQFTYGNGGPSGGGGAGYWMLGRDGTVYPFGTAGRFGSAVLVDTAAAIAPTPTGKGYWVASTSGEVQAFGDAATEFLSAQPTSATVSMSSTPDGQGLWVATTGGQVLTAGDATDFGSPAESGLNLAKGIVNMAVTADGKGYWLLGGDGGVFSYGDASFHGSSGQIDPTKPAGGSNAFVPNRPIVAMVATSSGGGYWMVGSDGGIFAFGDAGFFGSSGAIDPTQPPGGANAFTPVQPINGMVATSDGKGYWMVASDGGVFAFGDAGFVGSLGGSPPSSPIVGFAPV